MEVKITEERVHDSQSAESMVREVIKKRKDKGKKLVKVLADKGYDSHCLFNFLAGLGIQAGILVRKGSKVRGKSSRDNVVRRIRMVGVDRYKKEIGCGLRNLVESVFSVFKRWFGEYVMSRKLRNIEGEVFLKAMIMNWSFGMRSG